MAPQSIGILHPGEMGISIAAAAQHNGHQVHWASAGRSDQTRARAAKFGLADLCTVEKLCAECALLISVCPPHAAEELAHQVRAAGFAGLYLDANAISPQRAGQIGQVLASAGIAFVDGGIIGGPAWAPGRTWLYLSGSRAPEIAQCFADSSLTTCVLGPEPGKASALKMCFAAYTKGSTALLAAILATAESLGVREALFQQWNHDEPGAAEKHAQRVCRTTAKAWRFVGEMEEIAATFEGAGVPGDFHAGAAVLYGRLAQFKDTRATPSLEEVLGALLQAQASPAKKQA